MEKLIKKAYGKINLGLDVLRRRPDGYHEVKMIMQMVDIYDTLTFEKREDNQIVLSANREDIPCDESNLIYKAAKLLFDYKQVSYGVNIHLEKRIPVAAGMAGGSTDAAAALVGINKLFALGLSMEELKEIGVKIGADVPYCILGKTALAEGLGEILTVLPPLKESIVCLAKPSYSVNTGQVYKEIDQKKNLLHPDTEGAIKA
ncbi:MAG: 4-(cytidine 5'-diphospho)-2-C-methyl-D-erythritol kinase, partial [Lachnospiraceae bacterium]|nr:4-(cytidine 5'-diphospho)-2-C-methyl-D-erythritol kinase [Lachnospiraceae bacterium]